MPNSDPNIEDATRLFDKLEHSAKRDRLRQLYHARACDNHPGGPYDWQCRFHDSLAKQRAIISANQVGKSRSIGAEISEHLIGWYPDWWKGIRYNEPIKVCVAGRTNEETRNVAQEVLLGAMQEGRRKPDGTGWIPIECLGQPSFRQCGITNVVDTISIKHASGGRSILMFKAFEQGWLKFQGFEVDVMWFDEEPEDPRIFSEALTRLIARDGIFLFSNTPLLGMSEIVRCFLDHKPGTFFVNAGWGDAPHLTDQRKEEMKAIYPEHERETRTSGTPLMGTGAVYPIADELILCPVFPIPAHFRRICGIDFGIDHPGAAAWLALDSDADTLYLYDAYKESGKLPAYHAQAITARGKWIPVAWPQDGMQRDKGSGVPLAHQYSERGVNMLPNPASWDSEFQDRHEARPQSREAGVMELLERMHTGRFKVLDTPACRDFLREKQMLHRKDAKIVAVNDDIESAVRYGLMDLRYATTKIEVDRPRPDHVEQVYDPLGMFSRS